MRKRLIFSGFALVLGASVAVAATPPANSWEIGPIIRGKNYSVGMPLRPAATQDGWTFDFPVGSRKAGHVHYVTFDPGRLSAASRIVVRYRVDAAPGTRFLPQEQPNRPGTVSLFLQRRGDNWSARGRYESYRWYVPGRAVIPLAPGTHTVTVRLDEEWGNVNSTTSFQDPAAFRAALEDTARLGIAFGSTTLRSHGVYATGPARFTLLALDIE